ncbi:hypothetical protein WA158_004245 [Blastocystis sp. Blastoise]
MAKLKLFAGCYTSLLGDDDLFGYSLFLILIGIIKLVFQIMESVCFSQSFVIDWIWPVGSGAIGLEIWIQFLFTIILFIIPCVILYYNCCGTIFQSNERKLVSPLVSIYIILNAFDALYECMISSIYLYFVMEAESNGFSYFYLNSLMSLIILIIDICFLIITRSFNISSRSLHFLLRCCCGCYLKDESTISQLVDLVINIKGEGSMSIFDLLIGVRLVHLIQKYKTDVMMTMKEKELYTQLKYMPSGQFLYKFVTDNNFRVQYLIHDIPTYPSPLSSPDLEDGLYYSTTMKTPTNAPQIYTYEFETPVAKTITDELAFFFDYATVPYGTSLIFLNKMNKKNGCCKCFETQKEVSFFNSETIQKSVTDLGGELVLLFDKASVCKPTWLLAVDPLRKLIIISIRGTFSIEDVFTDGLVKNHGLASEGIKYGFSGEGEYCHEGMWRSAYYIYSQLISTNILSFLYNGDNLGENVQLVSPVLPGSCEGFELIFAGHSMGGGTAALLTLMYRSQFKHMRCFCADPPGETMSVGASNQIKDITISSVYGNDLFPRLSMYTLVNFEDVLNNCLCLCKLKKISYKYIIKDHIDDISNYIYMSEWELPTEKRDYLLKWNNLYNRKIESTPVCIIPGQIVYIHFVNIDKKRIADSVTWSDPNEFNEIIFQKYMWRNHFIYNFSKWIMTAAKRQNKKLK